MRPRGALLGVADSAVSSLGNLAVSVVAANALGLAEFGAFSVAMLCCLIVLGVSRALHNEPMVLTASASADSERRATASRALGAVVVATLGGAAVVAVGLATVGHLVIDVRVPLAACAVVPVLAAQDFYRAVEYTAGRPARALANSAAWTAALAVGLVVLRLTVTDIPAWSLLALWGASAAAGLCVGAVTTSIWPALRDALTWYSAHRTLARRLLTDFVLLQATAEGAIVLVAVVAGTREVGLVRLAQVPLGPIIVLTAGVVSVMQPAAVRGVAAHATPHEVRSRAYRSGAAAAGLALVASCVVWALPTPVLGAVLGPAWGDARGLVPILGVFLSLGVLAACLGVSLRAAGLLNEQLKVRYVLVPITMIVVIVGSATAGAVGASGALCLSVFLIVVAWCRLLGRITPEVLAAQRPVRGVDR